MKSERSDIPSVDEILRTHQAAELVNRFGRPLVIEAIRSTLSDVRAQFQPETPIPTTVALFDRVAGLLDEWLKPTLLSVINASGVILHTNLGRAPLSKNALKAIQNLSFGYCSLEYDLENGKRGSRSVHAENLLKRLTGAEAAFVVNNNAAAVLICLSALANRRRVIISRSQLVEIGGGFRIPDVMRQSGAKLIEIGTTNRVHLNDYEVALQEPTALVMRAHPSNFRIIGFTSEPELAEIVSVSHRTNIPVLDDLGSGTFLDTSRFGLIHEPTILESIHAGVDVVTFSGDKLLGGPQAGIIVGKKVYIDKIKKHPLARAVRPDKLCLAALTESLLHYLKNEAEREIPIWQMISKTPDEIKARAERWQMILEQGEVIAGVSTIGGGSLPEETLPTFLLGLKVKSPTRFLTRLRQANPPVIARIENDLILFDPRTVLSDQEGALLVGIKNALGGKI